MTYNEALAGNLHEDLLATKLTVNSLRRELKLIRQQHDEKEMQLDLVEKRIDYALERHTIILDENKRLRETLEKNNLASVVSIDPYFAG